MKVEQGQIVFLNFPFSDGSGTKVRPAVVLQSNRENQRLSSTVVAMISSNRNPVVGEPPAIFVRQTRRLPKESLEYRNELDRLYLDFDE